MWDSRTAHCNHPPTKLSDEANASTTLKRLVGYICILFIFILIFILNFILFPPFYFLYFLSHLF